MISAANLRDRFRCEDEGYLIANSNLKRNCLKPLQFADRTAGRPAAVGETFLFPVSESGTYTVSGDETPLVFFNGESVCVSDDWNNETAQGLNKVCKLRNRRCLAWVRDARM